MKDENIYLESIVENIEYIFEFILGFSYDRYIWDIKTKMAVERCLENIWEAVKHLWKNLKKEISNDIPWKEIAWMRDILVHDYLHIDDDIVWDVIINKLPKINNNINNFLKKWKS